MKKVIRYSLRAFLFAALLSLVTLGVTYLLIAPGLPEVDSLRDVQLQVPLRVYSKDLKLIGLFGEKRRIPVTIDEIPDNLKNAFIAGEDARFYEHPGVDYQGISRAAFTLLVTGEKSIGGSTITQQLARNFFLTSEKTFTRKIKEILLALKIEGQLDKDEILELYLNKIFLGYRAYGVGAAAEVYYGKPIQDLSLAQCAMIAALPKAPSRINPISQPERALERRNYVLNRMLELNYIDKAQYAAATSEPDRAFYHGATAEISAPYVAEMARARSLQLLGPEAYTGGYKVITTIDSRLQTAADLAVAQGLEDYDKRHGYRGPEARIDLKDKSTPEQWDELLEPYQPVSGLAPGLVIEVEDDIALVYLRNGQTIALDLQAWAAPFISRDRIGKRPKSMHDVLAVGDVIRTRLDDNGHWQLGQIPEVEAALVSIDPWSGDIKALVGGYDFSRSKYNRIIQGRRQPGSSFKPFIYSAALEKGFTTASLINDAPIVFDDTELERTWKPQNFSEKFYGPTRLREAIVHSRNLVSIRLLRDIGIDYARHYVTNFGFDLAELPDNLTLALGSGSVTPLSMARGYAVFANGGYLINPEFIREIQDNSSQLVYETHAAIICDDCREPVEEEVADADTVEQTRPEFRPLEMNPASDDVILTDTIGKSVPPVNDNQPVYAQKAITPQNAYLVRSMMMDVIKRGTGVRVMQMGRHDLAGKTGTTNEQRDAWFSGYNDNLVTSVWVGFDNHDPLGRNEQGGRAALPIWMEFMAVALQGIEDRPPKMPEGLAQAKIDPKTGLIARLDNTDAIMEVFEVGNMPPMEADAGGENQDASPAEDPYENY